MGRTKHGKDSAKAKACARYKSEGRLMLNKQKKAEKLSVGKKIKSRKTSKTSDMKWNTFIRNTVKTKPCVDSNGIVYWGKDKNNNKSKVA